MYIGSHILILKGIYHSLETAKKINASIIQIFTRSPQSIKGSCIKLTKEECSKIKYFCKKNNIKIVIHSSYLVNLCQNKSWATGLLISDLLIADKIGAIGIVIHLGSRLNLTKKQAYSNFYKNIRSIIRKCRSPAKIILETSCGSGTQVASRLEDLADLYNLFNKNDKKRLGLCVDTCHIFVAGYPIHTISGMKEYFKKFNKLIGLSKLTLLHLNDSKTELGKHSDRHEKIGRGYIFKKNYKPLCYLLKLMKKKDVPIVLETHDKYPYSNYKKEIKLIKKLVISKQTGGGSIKKKIKDIFSKIVKYYYSLGLRFNALAYRNAIKVIDEYPGNLPKDKKKLMSIPGIGKSISDHIIQIQKTWTIKDSKKYFSNKKVNKIKEISGVLGIGPVLAKKIISSKINSIKDLRQAVKEGGIKLTNYQTIGLKYYNKLSKKIPRKEILSFDKYISKKIKEINKKKELLTYAVAGSYRRKLKESGDIDLIIGYKNTKDYVKMVLRMLKYIIIDKLNEGRSKIHCLIKWKDRVRKLDIIFLPHTSFIPGLLYFTGSKEHNIKMRRRAKDLGFTLNRYGLFKGKKKLKAESEKDFFRILKMKYLDPEKR